MSSETANNDYGPLNVLVVGAGMYTCGRGTDGFGTVLPALFEAARSRGLVGKITVCATSRKSVQALEAKVAGLTGMMGFSVPIETWPKEGTDPEAYRRVIAGAETPFDCAVLAVPDDKHYEMARVTVEAGIHTFLVKPFVTRLADGLDLVARAQARGVFGGVEFHKRYDHTNLVMRDELAAGRIGKPLYFHIEYSQRKVVPEEIFAQWVENTNIFQYLGVHYADMVYFLTDALPTRVMAVGQKAWLSAKGIDTWDAMQVLVEWDDTGHRFVSSHLTNWVDPNCTSTMSDQAIKVIGTQGRIECDQKHRGLQIVDDAGGIEEVNPYFGLFYGDTEGARKTFSGYGFQSFLRFLEDVRSVVEGERTADSLHGARPTFRSSLVSTAIVDSANQSLAADGAWVVIDAALAEALE